jgi:hypothetical protein
LRPDKLSARRAALIDKLLNWDFANEQLATAKKG